MKRLPMLLGAAVFAAVVLWSAQADPPGTAAAPPVQSGDCAPTRHGAVTVNYCPGHAAFYGGYTTDGWTATVYPDPGGLGVLLVTPDRSVDPADWHLSVNGQLFAPVNNQMRFEGLPLPADAAEPRMTYHFEVAACGPDETSLDCLADGRKRVFVPTGNLAADAYRWEDWPSAIRWSAHAREHTFLVFQGVPLALPSVLDAH